MTRERKFSGSLRALPFFLGAWFFLPELISSKNRITQAGRKLALRAFLIYALFLFSVFLATSAVSIAILGTANSIEAFGEFRADATF